MGRRGRNFCLQPPCHDAVLPAPQAPQLLPQLQRQVSVGRVADAPTAATPCFGRALTCCHQAQPPPVPTPRLILPAGGTRLWLQLRSLLQAPVSSCPAVLDHVLRQAGPVHRTSLCPARLPFPVFSTAGDVCVPLPLPRSLAISMVLPTTAQSLIPPPGLRTKVLGRSAARQLPAQRAREPCAAPFPPGGGGMARGAESPSPPCRAQGSCAAGTGAAGSWGPLDPSVTGQNAAGARAGAPALPARRRFETDAPRAK